MLSPRFTPGSSVTREVDGKGWRLEIPAGEAGRYRLAQLDDYGGLRRPAFPWRPPFHMRLRARASGASIPGTWGFGLWNDPFGLAIGFGGGLRLPALPEAAWFFFASPPNYLSLHDDLPAHGGLAASFHSRSVPTPFLALGVLVLPLLILRPFSRGLRRLGRRFVHQDATALAVDVLEWHTYHIDWAEESVVFSVDGQAVLETRGSPRAPLGLVIWVDNQYAAWAPDGRAGYGTLANPHPAWIEIEDLDLGHPF